MSEHRTGRRESGSTDVTTASRTGQDVGWGVLEHRHGTTWPS